MLLRCRFFLHRRQTSALRDQSAMPGALRKRRDGGPVAGDQSSRVQARLRSKARLADRDLTSGAAAHVR